ncbi:MAG: DMT family transporter [Blastomonas sp.]
MRETSHAPVQNITAGMALALCGFGMLSMGDGVIKSLAGEWPGTAVAALRYVFGAMGLGVLLFLREGRAGFRLPKPGAQLARGFFVALATLAFFVSIFVMPLATATSIQFINPMLTAIISAIWLKEAAGRTTWIATLLAFVGVLIVLRPNFAELGWMAVLPLVAAFGLSAMMIANRSVAGSGGVLLMQFLISAIAAPFLILASIAGHFSGIEGFAVGLPGWHVIGVCALVGVTASVSHMLIYLATARASAANVAPMVYVQLLVALAIGMLFYGDFPDLVALGGSVLIVASGLWLWRRNKLSASIAPSE